ncbi:MAG TPA: hypothetical protein VJ476_01605 [Rhizomicrobium sp.]|nr:hypothetical protein [Rhizomicrobium sp.]
MTRLSIAFCALLATVIVPAPALAMHWAIYAPDELSYRYWIDRDSIVRKNDGYTYFTWLALGPDSAAPLSPDGNHSAINCDNGNSIKEDNGQWVTGPHFTDAAYLFKFVCH